LIEAQIDTLERYRDWLVDEARPAGGIGPHEAPRVGERHILDSLLFASALDDPGSVWDVGTGVGLPGVPLAVLLPETEFLLIDRSSRRTTLARRAVRILELGNVTVVNRDVRQMTGSTDAVVSRASMAPETLADWCLPHLHPGGVIVVGGSWVEPPVVEGWATLSTSVLDREVWLLMMRAA
jgi:16S rRNA (guanine527-N7)-methyltransferase